LVSKQVKARWTGQHLEFVGYDNKNHSIVMNEDVGIRPGLLLLLGLAGCTGMDVVSIMQKKRQQITGLEVIVTGYQPEDYPKPFTRIEVEYVVRGRNIDPQAVERSIELSETKYCHVAQTVAGVAQLSHTYRIVEE
jgi:putative redox protein